MLRTTTAALILLAGTATAQNYQNFQIEQPQVAQNEYQNSYTNAPNQRQIRALQASDVYTGQRYEGERNWDLELGAQSYFQPEYSGSDEYEFTAQPLVNAEYRFIFDPRQSIAVSTKHTGYNVGYNFAYNNELQTGLQANYRFERDSGSSSKLNGMPDVDAALEVGPYAVYNFNQEVSTRVDILVDAWDEHNGYVIDLGAHYDTVLQFIPEQIWEIGLSGTLQYADQNYTQAYHGVKNANVTATRRAFTADAGFHHLELAANGTYLFDENWFIRIEAILTQLLGDAADSPLTEDETQILMGFGIGYRF